MLRAAFLFALALLSESLFAQDLTGTWEGTEEGNYMKLVIVKVGDQYIGYTYDTDQMGGWCRANFAGIFSPGAKKLKGSGQGMIAMKGTHVQCDFELTYSRNGSTEHLIGIDRTKGSGNSLFDRIFGSDDGPVELRKISPRYDTTAFMRGYLREPPPMAGVPPRTVPPKPEPATAKAKTPAKPATVVKRPPPRQTPVAAKPKPRVTTPVASQPRRDTARPPVVRVAPPPVTPARTASPQLLNLRQDRRTELVQEIATTEPVITIRVYDNGVFDGDTVSILHNNAVIADHRVVAVNYFEFTVRLDDGNPVHDITLIAHNVGTIPPNTASLTIIAGEERYRLTASTDLSKNAVVRFRYKPD